MVMETIPPSEVNAHLVRNALRHQWPVILVAVLVMAAAGAFVGRGLGAAYNSTSSVLLKATIGNVLSPDSSKSSQQITVAMTTEAELVTSPQVTDLVNKKLGTTIPASSSAVSVTVPVSTQILQIAVNGTSAEDAQARTEAFADAFLTYRTDQSKALIDQQVKDLTAQEKAASDGLKKATTDAAAPQPSADAVARLQLYSSRVATLQDSITTLTSTSTDPGVVVAPATLPSDASGLPSWIFLLTGGLLGLGLGGVLALWRERSDDRIRFTSVATVDGLPVLASLVGTAADEESQRQLRASVVRLSPAPGVLAIVPVSDAVPADLVLTVGDELARSLARSGYRTALVDATMRDETSGSGLGDWLLEPGSTELSAAAETVEGVDRVRGGRQASNARDLLAGDRFAAGVRNLVESHDYVLLVGTSPSSGSGADLALVADHGLAVGRERTTTHEHVRELIQRTARTGPLVLGLVAASRKAFEAPASSDPDVQTPIGAAATDDEIEGNASVFAGSEAEETQHGSPVGRGEESRSERRRGSDAQTVGQTVP